jgi:hypothetical protein
MGKTGVSQRTEFSSNDSILQYYTVQEYVCPDVSEKRAASILKVAEIGLITFTAREEGTDRVPSLFYFFQSIQHPPEPNSVTLKTTAARSFETSGKHL